MFFCGLLTFKNNFFENSFKNNMRVAKRLDLEQDHYFVGPDLSPYCFQKLISRGKESAKDFIVLNSPERTLLALSCLMKSFI